MSTQHSVRCCTTNSSLNWPDKCRVKPNPRVFGESNVPSCYKSSTFDEAVEICSAYDGGRLCSGRELLNKCTAGTGCSMNRLLVWGCTANLDVCTSDAECCDGLCVGGVCSDGGGEPSNPPTKDPTSLVSYSFHTCVYISCVLNIASHYKHSLIVYLLSPQPTISPTGLASRPNRRPNHLPAHPLTNQLLNHHPSRQTCSI